MAETRMEVDSMDTALAVFGSCDENIRLLEQALGVTVVCRGTELKFSGPEEPCRRHAARWTPCCLCGRAAHRWRSRRFATASRWRTRAKKKRCRSLAGGCIAITAKGRPVRPKTLGQKQYVEAILKNAVTFGVGPAGHGKTYLAVAMAVKAFKARQVSRIILTRPAVEAGEKLGFLRATFRTRWTHTWRPLYDALFDMLGAETYQKLLEKQLIEVAPLAYMRGRTLDDAFIILDEAQNTSPEQMKMFLTRMGTGSKVVVTGDVTQIDLPDKARSGLVDALQVLKNVQGIAMMFFSEKDVVRHRLVQEIIRAYDKAQGRQAQAGVTPACLRRIQET